MQTFSTRYGRCTASKEGGGAAAWSRSSSRGCSSKELQRDLNRLDVMHPAPIPSRAEPGADVEPFILHLFAALAEKKRAMIATRTRDALARAKARGVKLGGPKLAQARRAAVEAIEASADRHAANVLPIIREIQRAGATSLRAIADALNARGVPTARGGRWQAQTVSNALARLKPPRRP